jgi:hypothetical protein
MGCRGRDHFRNDEFRPILDLCKSRKLRGRQEPFDLRRFDELLDTNFDDIVPVLRFFDGLKYADTHYENGQPVDRYRWDRLVAFHLLVISFVNMVGYSWQRCDDSKFEAVAAQFKHPKIAFKLSDSMAQIGLRGEQEAERIVRAIDKVLPQSAERQAAPASEGTEEVIDLREAAPETGMRA